jgi:uncharacterized protein YjbI with pentapeptide repeats
MLENVNLSGGRIYRANLAAVEIADVNMNGVTISDAALTGMTINGILVTDLLASYEAMQLLAKSADRNVEEVN